MRGGQAFSRSERDHSNQGSKCKAFQNSHIYLTEFWPHRNWKCCWIGRIIWIFSFRFRKSPVKYPRGVAIQLTLHWIGTDQISGHGRSVELSWRRQLSPLPCLARLVENLQIATQSKNNNIHTGFEFFINLFPIWRSTSFLPSTMFVFVTTVMKDDEIDRVPLEDVEQIGEHGGDTALDRVRRRLNVLRKSIRLD